MADLLIEGGTVVTQNPRREVIDDGAVAVGGDRILAVGKADALADQYDLTERLDATGNAVIPGLVNPHTHVSDILLRGSCGTDRGLYDWLFNIKQPGIAQMTADEHELAAALYCAEALTAGVTTFVDNDAELPLGALDPMTGKFDAFEAAGIRSIYARGVRDLPADEGFKTLIERIGGRDPSIEQPDQNRYVAELDGWLDELESLSDDYHGSADGRHEIWVAPVVIEGMTDGGLRETYQFAERHDVMTTIHTAEAPEQVGGSLSPIEHLRNVGSLGEHALLAHCVYTDERDVRLLAETDTRVAHNIGSNMALGNGFAPLPTMRAHGVTVGLGTDNTTLSDTVNPLADLRLAAMAHRGHHQDPGVLPAAAALDMVTIEAARSLRKADTLGSLEAGKRADIVILDIDQPHLTPSPDSINALVYQALGTEVTTVFCDGDRVVDNGEPVGITAAYPNLLEEASAAGERIVAAAGIDESDGYGCERAVTEPSGVGDRSQ
jgi:cytosine/adenosine deaminase-related metal-dependent hydrolase